MPSRARIALRLLPALWAGVAAAAGGTEAAQPEVGAETAAAGRPGAFTLDHEVRGLRHWQPPGRQGPLADAQALQPGLALPAPGSRALEWSARLRWGALSARSWAAHLQQDDSRRRDELRLDELALSGERGAWAWSAGRQVVGWDVGQGFRPNDLVQQEPRRRLLPAPLQGRWLLQAEHFGADDALSLVWVNPQRLNAGVQRQRRADESALALRAWRRHGALDLHGFARLGRRSGASLGAAFAWVAHDEVALHGSLRWLQRHDGWRFGADAPASGARLLAANPWQLQLQGPRAQALIGATWTGESRLGLLVEAWHDGSAPSRRQWRDWSQRNAALARLGAAPAAPPALGAAAAGNLAWQATPLDGASLQRDQLFARLSWMPAGWQASADLLWQPADDGRIVTLGLQWQGDRWRLEAAWRRHGGPTASVIAQLPHRRQAVLAATRNF
ncbi:MAG: hypothetical protein L6Q75_15925 [Burkholderiaceae bacterium]|nr:hypothetical protein [Burkholderiaceae bacterium]